MKFLVKTKSTFENMYLVEAKSEVEARSIVMDNDNPPDFFQKHLGESIEEIHETDWTHTNLRNLGYF